MKKLSLILILVVVLVGLVWTRTRAVQTCYVWNTEAGDSALLELKTRWKWTTGYLNLGIAGKDTRSGEVKGMMNGNMAELLWYVGGEGVETKEELLVKIEDSIAQPAFGEMILSEGIYKYANPEALTYPINLQEDPEACYDDQD